MIKAQSTAEKDVLHQLRVEARQLCLQVDDGETASPPQVVDVLLSLHQPIVDSEWRARFGAELTRYVEAIIDQNQPDVRIPARQAMEKP